ncbi:MAG TPA: GNAT family N-acetyltransferase [Acidimicrobiia bacterium]|nr:GNAT family N-acetyltransferase [Acidimicrobiia bacterium]
MLRPFTDDDLDALVGIFAERAVWEYPFQRARTPEEAAAFLANVQRQRAERGFDLWASIERASGDLMGFIGLTVPTFLPEILPAVEVGWRIHPRFWGHGYATEGGDASLRYGFEQLGLDRIVSVYEPINDASGAVMRRLGMRHDRDTVHPERQIPVRVYAMTREEWEARGPLEPRC